MFYFGGGQALSQSAPNLWDTGREAAEMLSMENYLEGAAYLKERLQGFEPEVFIELGSGLGFLADECENLIKVPFGDVPFMENPTVEGHAGAFAGGMISGRKVLFLQGRLHLYEGRTPEQAAYPVRLAKLAGAKCLILTNAAGGVNPDFQPGDFMLLSDHLKLFSSSPLTGPNLSEFGPRFPDMSEAYSKRLRETAFKAAEKEGIKLREGIYCYAPGPQFETPAEVRAFRSLGADAVGMSTVMETIAAVHCGMEVLGVSFITNAAAGVIDGVKLNHQEVIDAAEKGKGRFSAFLKRLIVMMPHF